MQVSVENTSTLGRKVTIQVPREKVKSAFDAKVEELSRTMKIDGFRKGRIPRQVIEKKYGKQAQGEVITNLLDKHLVEVLKSEKLNPAQRPVVDEIVDENDKDLTYVVSFEVFPEIELKDFSLIKVEKTVVDLTEKDIDEALVKLREQNAMWDKVDRAAESGDKVNIDFEGYVDGELFEGGKADSYVLELGSGQFIAGFEDGLIGKSAGDEVSLELKFPENYVKDLASKDVTFKVKINEVTGRVTPELNDEFAKKLKIESGKAEDIREWCKKDIEKQLEKSIMHKLQDDVVTKLIEVNEIEVPQALVTQEAQNIHDEKHRKDSGSANHAHDDCNFDEEAKKRVSIGLILNHIISNEKLEVDMDRVNAKIQELATMFGNADFIKNMYYESEELMNGIKNTVLMEQVVDLILSKATVTEKTSSLTDYIEG